MIGVKIRSCTAGKKEPANFIYFAGAAAALRAFLTGGREVAFKCDFL